MQRHGCANLAGNAQALPALDAVHVECLLALNKPQERGLVKLEREAFEQWTREGSDRGVLEPEICQVQQPEAERVLACLLVADHEAGALERGEQGMQATLAETQPLTELGQSEHGRVRVEGGQ